MRVNNNKCLCIWHNIKIRYKQNEERCEIVLTITYNTHKIQCIYLSEFVVPNFIGGTLPRCDQGDHEYYCSTMLTLFKPWCTGHDLKGAEETWEQAFNKYIFSPVLYSPPCIPSGTEWNGRNPSGSEQILSGMVGI